MVLKLKELGIVDEIKRMVYDAPLRTCNYCHSFCVFKVPKDYGTDYDDYIELKSKFLLELFLVDKETKNLKGFIKLAGGH